MDKDQFDQATSSGPQAADGQALNARRRLLKGGLGLAPVAMTMASRPVLAGTETCHGPTGFQSAPPSRIGQTPSCTIGRGQGPSAWAIKSSSNYPGGADTANRHFSVAMNDARLFGSLTVRQVVSGSFGSAGGTSEDKEVARRVAAAYLNALSGQGFPMTVLQVQQLWQGYISKSYRPGGAGVVWKDAAQFLKYLNYVMSA
ncbi:hypothetical protein QWZ02_10880 [Kinneretia asaccharophila]|uniref:Uncharacterized protein n=1 Tax=Roseateles asaccharophilus TaxID=582607 RepID=A0A4V6PU88_9BURK|nr:hypothetical protein [Roseateles asaccharophilus]MDN3544947.1 hypothetical protein [Roseateles asaccharophilus]TDP12667.1 hypothetical protein DFR39_101140 [Roseateles asaccharophilus]